MCMGGVLLGWKLIGLGYGYRRGTHIVLYGIGKQVLCPVKTNTLFQEVRPPVESSMWFIHDSFVF